jgi:hypothetical protein
VKPAVGLFAKPVRPGRVKTRLTPPLSPDQAADLYGAFLADLANMLAGEPSWDWMVYSPDPEDQRATWPRAATAPPGWGRQEGNGLGERMENALAALLEAGRPGAILVGSDHPSLDAEALRRGLNLLESSDVVLGPTLDGGCYLVGLREPRPGLFRDIPWSTPGVLDRTLDRITAMGLRPGILPPWYDVDTRADLRFLKVHLRGLAMAGALAPCPITRRILDEIDHEL